MVITSERTFGRSIIVTGDVPFVYRSVPLSLSGFLEKRAITIIAVKLRFMNIRVNYVDNLRTVLVSSLIVVFMSPWFMPTMFLLAGVAASFSMKKRKKSILYQLLFIAKIRQYRRLVKATALHRNKRNIKKH